MEKINCTNCKKAGIITDQYFHISLCEKCKGYGFFYLKKDNLNKTNEEKNNVPIIIPNSNGYSDDNINYINRIIKPEIEEIKTKKRGRKPKTNINK